MSRGQLVLPLNKLWKLVDGFNGVSLSQPEKEKKTFSCCSRLEYWNLYMMFAIFVGCYLFFFFLNNNLLFLFLFSKLDPPRCYTTLALYLEKKMKKKILIKIWTFSKSLRIFKKIQMFETLQNIRVFMTCSFCFVFLRGGSFVFHIPVICC